MSRRLLRNVAVDGVVLEAGTGDDHELADRIVNPAAWDGPAEPGDQQGGGQGEQVSPSEVPPRGGAGSGKDAWAAYAAKHEVSVPHDATRDDIIAALAAAGVPTE